MKAMTSNYLSVHIFYNVADLRAILLECVEPLVRRLESRGMIERYFVIRYWEGGAHVRLRLLPAAHVSHDELKVEVEPAIERFLEDRPSLFDPDPEVMAPLMRRLYVMEYGEKAYEERYGSTGLIPLQPNNSYAYIPYVPEYSRYGGIRGMEMSELHFHNSSNIAFDALRDINSSVRTSTLGMAFQMMLHFCYAFFEDRSKVIAFFRGYGEFFQGVNVPPDLQAGFDRVFDRQSASIVEQTDQLEAINLRLRTGEMGALSKYVIDACHLRKQVDQLYAAGQLEFLGTVESADQAASRLLTSYIHMTNNRLGLLIIEEVYMANMIVRSLEGDV